MFLCHFSSHNFFQTTVTEAYNTTVALQAQKTLWCTGRREEAQASAAAWPSPSREAAAERGLTPLCIPGACLYLNGMLCFIQITYAMLSKALEGEGEWEGSFYLERGIPDRKFYHSTCQPLGWFKRANLCSRTKAVFPSKGSGFSSSEKSFVSTVIGRKNCMTIGLESCTHHQLECKLLWQNLTEECSIAMQNSKELLI